MDHDPLCRRPSTVRGRHPSADQEALVNIVSLALEIHAQLEEEIFYPAVRRVVTDPVVIDKSVPEHVEIRRLIARLREMAPGDAGYDRTFMELMRDVMHHVADEEPCCCRHAERMLAGELGELGARMTRRRPRAERAARGEIAGNTLRAMPASTMLMGVGAAPRRQPAAEARDAAPRLSPAGAPATPV
jgi:hypothetical protein